VRLSRFPLLGMLSREMLMRWRDRMREIGKGLEIALGATLVATGLMVAPGYDKAAETVLVNASPDWLTSLATRL
jgi:cytochrome c-type biogenesis protein